MTRVLLADSDLVVRSAMALLLRHKLGVRDICEIGDAGQLSERLFNFNPDVLLLDWELPGLDVRHFCSEFRPSFGKPVVIVMSVKTENESRALVSGADAFLNKGASGETVLKLLRGYVSPV